MRGPSPAPGPVRAWATGAWPSVLLSTGPTPALQPQGRWHARPSAHAAHHAQRNTRHDPHPTPSPRRPRRSPGRHPGRALRRRRPGARARAGNQVHAARPGAGRQPAGGGGRARPCAAVRRWRQGLAPGQGRAHAHHAHRAARHQRPAAVGLRPWRRDPFQQRRRRNLGRGRRQGRRPRRAAGHPRAARRPRPGRGWLRHRAQHHRRRQDLEGGHADRRRGRRAAPQPHPGHRGRHLADPGRRRPCAARHRQRRRVEVGSRQDALCRQPVERPAVGQRHAGGGRHARQPGDQPRRRPQLAAPGRARGRLLHRRLGPARRPAFAGGRRRHGGAGRCGGRVIPLATAGRPCHPDRRGPPGRWAARCRQHGRATPPGKPEVNAAAPFHAARDFLLAHRTDRNAAVAGFRWPQLGDFNWALDHFDPMALGNESPGLWIVGEDGREHRFSFEQLRRQSNAVANHLRARGVQRGHVVLLMMGNEPALWLSMLACIKLGAVVVPATTLLSRDDLQDRFDR
ncbi:MAG: acyl-CoA synthetase, partial [Rubrivivax sp.]|nr:acyl-CoA synthetase [Rubrivivax sp.]